MMPALKIYLLSALALSFVCTGSLRAQTLYVAANGDDRNAGTAEKPLATLGAARDIARKITGKPVEVIVRSGTYFMQETLVLSEEDRREENAALIFRGENGATPVFYGGKRIPKFKKVSEQLWRVYLPEAALYGWNFQQLYINGRRAVRAQAPNSGFYKPRYVRETILLADSTLPSDFAVQKIGMPVEGMSWLRDLSYDELQDVMIHFYHKWDNTTRPVRSLSLKDTSVAVSGRVMQPWNQIGETSTFRIENVKSALDAPGEWYLEKSGFLYYIPLPGETPENTTALAPVLDKFVEILGTDHGRKNVSHIHFENLAFRVARYQMAPTGAEALQAAATVEAAVQVDFADHISFRNCEISQTGGNAIWFRRAVTNSRVEQCFLHDLGAGGVKIGETFYRENPKDISHHIIVDNNIIRSGGKVFPCAVAVIIFNGHDNSLTHNEVADFRYSAISVGWVWGYGHSPSKRNFIAYNHLHHIGWGELSDMGGVYTLGPSEGTVVRNNVIHHIYAYDYGGWGLYTDEGSTGVVMENNLVYACKNSGFHQHYGKENIIRNNIFANNLRGQLQGTRVEPHLSLSFTNNIVYYGSGTLLLSNWHKMNISSDWNCYFDTRTPGVRFAGETLEEWRRKGKDAHSLIADPGFVDPGKYDFRFRDTEVIRKINFRPFDYSEAGVYGSESWKTKARLDPAIEKAFDQMVLQHEAGN